jgi:ubiquinol-cytochrome c reductase cytochrome b subunit
VLPGLLIFFLVLHVFMFRRHGLTARIRPGSEDVTFWPDQVLKDSVACLAVLATVLFLVFYLGAELGAPADPANNYSAARPEWYFLFLFQLLKYFPGESEVIGAIVIPGIVVGLLFLMPIIGRWKVGHGFNVGLLMCLFAGVIYLTWQAVKQDLDDLGYRNAVWEAHRASELAHERADKGIPAVGARVMMRDDPKAQALTAITRQCLSCHAYTDENGKGYAPEKPAAPNLVPTRSTRPQPRWLRSPACRSPVPIRRWSKRGARFSKTNRAAARSAISFMMSAAWAPHPSSPATARASGSWA